MGCAASVEDSAEETSQSFLLGKSEKALRSAILIQRWFRRCQARLEARRRCTWKIFQSIEYAGEQDQLKLFNFFNDMLTHVNDGDNRGAGIMRHGSATSSTSTASKISSKLEQLTDPSLITVDESMYDGPHVTLPLKLLTVRNIIERFKSHKLLHVKYILLILREQRTKLMALPNISKATTRITKQITICGDLHGKLSDLFMIFHKNGLPSAENPYIFNGDIVDRGPKSVEIAIILFAFFLLYPTGVYINRGNHEDHIMNLRYGFVKEVMDKYKEHSTKVMRLFADIFGWLPLATVVNNKILVTHGGISNITDLSIINKIDRHKYISVLKPPSMDKVHPDTINLMEWRQVLDLLWSDPKPMPGCKPNTFRGGGCYFGPDITERILRKHSLELLVRSHECKYEGYEYMHGRKVITIFSASNYYEQGSNRGAYMKIGPDMKPYFVQYQVSKTKKHLTLKQRVGIVEESAIRDLRERFYANKTALMTAFLERDKGKTGYITGSQWSSAVESVLKLDVPWNMLRHQLVNVLPDGRVDYASCLDQYVIEAGLKKNGPSITETLYRNRSNLETIFRLMDKDNSGVVSMDEFEESCRLLNEHANSNIPLDSIEDLAKSIDMDKDGHIDFNEFLEAFRLVDNSKSSLTLKIASPVNSIHIIS
ncbi:serine/threonine-protein phosphatase with EF-hands 2-like isoform X1 [Montipora capricornis]|uniref:serine/threonine-protein phosphatase with EF-hands 2-like isoform X1 n=2 Tax=Montipora capricornis TaxID=246305 RepID=UPI0035F1DE88